MSGKKASEVADVLAGAKQARKLTEGMYDGAFTNYRRDILACEKKLKDIQKGCEGKAAVSDTSRELYAGEAKEQSVKFQNLQQQVKNMKLNLQDLKNKERELKNISENLVRCDEEADEIAEIIRNKPHYCDPEYNRAERLRGKYQELAQKRRTLDREISALAGEAQGVVNRAESLQSQLEGVKRIIANINEMAANQKAADGLKKQIQKELNKIIVKDAQKFMSKEYSEILALEKQISGKNNQAVIKEAPALLTKMNKFNSDLQYKVAVWKQQKADAEAARTAAERPTTAEFMDPLEYWDANDESKVNKFKVFRYLEKYVQTGYERNYSDLKSKAEKAMAGENFVEAQKLYKQMESVAVEARDCAAQLQEKMIKNADMAYLVEEVMHSENYDTDWVTINNNPNDGFKIICTVGDETIDFNITCEDGKPRVNIDHTEARNSSCKNTWGNLVKKFREAGLPITDVKKNGKSILAAERKPDPVPDSDHRRTRG